MSWNRLPTTPPPKTLSRPFTLGSRSIDRSRANLSGSAFVRPSPYRVLGSTRTSHGRNGPLQGSGGSSFAKDLRFSRRLRVFIPTSPRWISCRTVPHRPWRNARLETEGFWRDYAVALVQQAQGDRAAADASAQGFHRQEFERRRISDRCALRNSKGARRNV